MLLRGASAGDCRGWVVLAGLGIRLGEVGLQVGLLVVNLVLVVCWRR